MVTHKAAENSSKPKSSKSSRSQTGPHAGIFWAFVKETEQKSESDRIVAIRSGLSIMLPVALRDALKIDFSHVARLLNTWRSTLERRMKSSALLDCIASERLDRIAQITGMAKIVLENREDTARWLTRAHPALNQQAPISLCDTGIGAWQVRRILSALEWGNSA